MKRTFETTKNKAVATAKEQLRRITGLNRLNNVRVQDVSCQCACGETAAVCVTVWYDIPATYTISMQTGKKIQKTPQRSTSEHVIVGICKACAE